MKSIAKILFLFLFSVTTSYAQSIKFLNDTSFNNYYDIKKAFEAEWESEHGSAPKLGVSEKEEEEEGEEDEEHEKENEYIQFKRWEEFVGPRVYPSGNLDLISSTYYNFTDYQKSLSKLKSSVSGKALAAAATPWTFAGPPGTNDGGRNGGRMNFIRFDPSNSNTIYAGAPAGGLWKSTDGGAIWRPYTDFLPVIGCSDLGIDPTNTNILYLATGDNDGGSTRSIGIMKSMDGGVTWTQSGLAWTPNQNRQISRVLVNPVNPQIVMCFGSQGVYRSINGGTTWTQTLTGVGYIKDAELKPNDPNIVYAVSNRVYRSADGGVTFTIVNGGTPTTDVGRSSLDVTPANPNYVYLFVAKGNGDFKGLYRSEDAGLNFTLRSDPATANILGYSATYGSGNQTGYDMAFSACKSNAEILIGAGVRNWRSTDGGVTWAVATLDCQNSRLELHWDIHYLEFLPGSTTTAFAACDGGVYKTVNTGTCWTAINQNNISVNQIYGFGLAADNPEIMISGHQDGATVVHTNGTYRSVLGGDGFQAFVDRTNSKVMYGELYYGGFSRSIDGGVTWTWLADNPGLAGLDGAWNTPWCQDPIEPNSIWAGYDQVLKSTDRGNNWVQVGALPGSGKMRDVKVAPSNNQTVYACRPREIYITKNAGGTWTNITAGLPNLEITRIAVSGNNPLLAWVTVSGYTANQKVYETTNGGTSWTSISAGLPNLPANCIQYVPGSTINEIYVGCDVGVYYKNSNTTSWTPYFDGLPYAPVFDIEIYVAGKEIRVATHGRGIWKCPLNDINNTNQLPTVSLTSPASNASFCQGAAIALTATASDPDGTISKVEFFDGTLLLATVTASPYTFNWVNAGAGAHSITAKATDNGGASKTSVAVAITVVASPLSPTVTTPISYCQNATASALTATGTALKWYTVPTNGTSSATAPTPSTTATGTTSYYVSQTVNSCESVRAMIAVTVNAAPSSPTVTTPISYCQNATATALTATGTALKWYTAPTNGTGSATAPTPSTTATGTTSYYVSQTVNSCESVRAMIAVTVNASPSSPTVTTPISYCQNATATALTATGTALKWYTVPTNGTSSAAAPTPSTTATGTTSYYVSQTVNSCESVRAMIAVTVNALPSATITPGGPTSFPLGGSVVLSANTGTGLTYKWFNGSAQVGTAATYTATGGGNYTVEVTNASGCKQTSSAVMVTVNNNQSPVVSIISPANNATFTAPANIIISATASDPDGTVAKVDFYNGTTLLGTDPTSPYNFAFNNVGAGTYTITAKATDNMGAVATSSVIIITVTASNQLPIVGITAPPNGSSYTATATIVIEAIASDGDGTVSKVDFYNGNILIGTAVSAPYSFTWTNVAAGVYTITAKATDNNGGVTTSAAITVSVGTQTGIFSRSGKDAQSKVYPNPSASLITIETSINLKVGSLQFTDASGSEVFVPVTVNGTDAEADVSQLPCGVYTLMITQDEFIIIKKITVIP